MNIIRIIVVSIMIIVKWENFCLCNEYQLKVAEDIDTQLERFQSHVKLWDVLSKIFQYDGSVTVIIEDFIKTKLTWYNSFIRLLQMKLGLAVTVLKLGEHSKRTPTTNKLNDYPRNTNTSYILIMDEVRMYTIFLQESKLRSENWNSRTRFAVITYEEELSNIHDVFRLMWNDYGIGKVIAFDIKTRNVAAYNFLIDEIRAFNVSNVEGIFKYSSREKDLEGYPIKVIIVHNPPTSIAIPNSTKFDGVNQILLDTLEKYMNFTMVMCKPTFRDRFGAESSTGTISNTPKQVANREIDIDANMKFITGTDTNGLEFTTPFFTERIHFVVRKAERVPLWLSTYQIFDNKVWIPTLCLFVISVVFWLYISKFHYKTRGGEIGLVTIDVLFLMTGRPISKRLSKCLEQLLIIFGSIFAIIMTSCFTGNLFQKFSEVTYYPEIDSLEELEKSGLPLLVGSYGVTSALNGTEDPLLKRLLEKTDNFNNLSTAFDSKNGVLDHAVLARLTQIQFELANHLIENNGTQLLHTMKQSLGRFSMAFIVPKGWFFLEHFNIHINRILESGMIQKWYYNTTLKYSLRMLKLSEVSHENLPRPFTLSDLTLAWCVLSCGLATGCITLLIEIIRHSQIIKKAQKTLCRIVGRSYLKFVSYIIKKNSN